MNDDAGAVSLELDLTHPPQKVWRALTDPVMLGEWLLPVAGFSSVVGTAFTFRAPEFPGWDGTVSCRILESDAPRKLSYAWAVAPMHLDTVVTFTLTPTATGTHLSLVQSGFGPDQRRNLNGARHGWRMMTDKLSTLLGRTES